MPGPVMIHGSDITRKAVDANGIGAYLCVKQGTNPGDATITTAPNDLFLGVTVFAQPKQNHFVETGYLGMRYFLAASAIALGDRVACTGGGMICTANTTNLGASAKANVVGYAEEAATAVGDQITVRIVPHMYQL